MYDSPKITVAMIASERGDVPSQTFIRAQRDGIDALVNYYNNGIPPTCMNGARLTMPRDFTASEIYRTSLKGKLNRREALIAASLIRENTDVVFAQFGMVGAGIQNVCKTLELPLIVHFHGHDISKKRVIKKYKKKYLEMFECAARIIAVSRYMENTLLNMGCPKEKIAYNTYGPSDDFYDIRPAFNQKIFVGAGRFTRKKAPQNTISAFKKTLEKHPDAKLILAGKGTLLNTCKSIVKKNKIENSVIFHGAFTHEQLRQYLRDATAFVQHSVIAPNGDMEGTPIVILEASAAGLPIISTLHAGIPDVVIDGVTGLLVKEGDIDGMAQNMIRILDNPQKATAMGGAGKENIKNNFNMKKHIGTLNEIIRNAAEQRRAAFAAKNKPRAGSKQISVSIIIPLYNKEQWFKRCFDSVVKQTYKNIECVIVEDCSTDNSLELARRLIADYTGEIKFSLIKHKQNGGLSAARNTGIDNSNGEYIYFLDSDDEITENCVDSLVTLAIKYPGIDMVQGNVYQYPRVKKDWYNLKTTLPEFVRGNLNINYLKGFPINAWNKLIRREFITRNGLYFKNGIIHEDYHWRFFVMKKIETLSFAADYCYIRHFAPDSIMNNPNLFPSISSFLTIAEDILDNLDASSTDRYLPKIRRLIRKQRRRISSNEKYSSLMPKCKALLERASKKGPPSTLLDIKWFAKQAIRAALKKGVSK